MLEVSASPVDSRMIEEDVVWDLREYNVYTEIHWFIETLWVFYVLWSPCHVKFPRQSESTPPSLKNGKRHALFPIRNPPNDGDDDCGVWPMCGFPPRVARRYEKHPPRPSKKCYNEALTLTHT